MPLPLHVFETRYRKMVADALAAGRTIGMTLLRPGWEQDYEGRPPVYPVGCAGVIDRHERLEDGRYNLLLRGRSRFRIVDEQGGEPYRLAVVEPLSDPPGDPQTLDDLRRRVLSAIARDSEGPAALVLQGEPPHDVLVNGLSQGLDLSPIEKQSLLDCDTLEARYSRLLSILEFRLLERAAGGSGGLH